MLSQVSENRDLKVIFDDLIDPTGSELYLKSAGDYVELERPVNFYTITETARQRGEVHISYRISADSSEPKRGYGVQVNPPKSQPINFTEGDPIFVLAEK